MLLHPIVQRDADDGGGQAGHDDLGPQAPGAALLLGGFRAREGIELVEEEHAHRQDRAKLDHDQEHVPEVARDVKRHELVEQQHVAGRGDGQPFGDALHEAKERRLEDFGKTDCKIHVRPPADRVYANTGQTYRDVRARAGASAWVRGPRRAAAGARAGVRCQRVGIVRHAGSPFARPAASTAEKHRPSPSPLGTLGPKAAAAEGEGNVPIRESRL